MEINKKDLELLSAYIDDELSEADKIKFEDKIKSSLVLQKKLEDLKNLKKRTSSVKNISESPYFETRLISAMDSNDSNKRKFSRWAPAFSLTLLILTVMAVLRFHPGFLEDIWEQQKTNLAGFYNENLQPLLFAANLSNEDIFNFAFNSNLPLDQERKQFLLVGYDASGKEYFEIKNASLVGSRDDYKNFIKTLELNVSQQQKVDSILGSYADALQSQVLVNENNTVAINPNLWNYRQAIAADLIVFAHDLNKKEFRRIVPTGIGETDRVKIVSAKNTLNSVPNQNYIFFTPDSVFSEVYVFDPAKLGRDMKDVELKISGIDKSLEKVDYDIDYDSIWKKNDDKKFHSHQFSVIVDSNVCRVVIPKFNMSDFRIPDFDSINAVINEATKNVKFYAYRIPKIEHMQKGFKIEYFDGDSVKSYEYKFENYNYDSLLGSSKILIDSFNTQKWRQFENFNDSFALKFKMNFDESFKNFNHKQLEEQMQKLREEMQRFREEMNQWQSEMKKQKTRVDVN